MRSSKNRIDRYVSVASLPAMAAVGGAATVSQMADGDIVYQGVSITIGGVGTSPFSGTLDMGVATVGFSAGNVSGKLGGMFAYGNSQVAIIGSSTTIPKANRFGAGDTIDAGSSAWLKSGLGAASFVKSSGKKGSKTFGFGEWALGGDAETSGYLGFALLGDAVGAGAAPSFGWISLAWDGTFLTIDGYAYETEAGVGIEAGAIPAPGAIGLLGLAAGAAGMRRKRQA